MNRKALSFWIVIVFSGLVVCNLQAEERALLPITETEFRQMGTLLVETRRMDRDDLFVTAARFVLHYVDDLLKETEEGESARTDELRKFARGAVANIANSTWPGWGPVSKEAKELGRSAAKLYLEYEIEAGDVSHWAYWVNGAHALADSDYEEAESMFSDAEAAAEVELFKATQSSWIALTKFLDNPNDETKEVLDAGVSRIRATEHATADSLVSQLMTAKDIFEQKEESKE